jgi:peptidoglycan hydrolase-like protein with peptidoglycan-binding domain
MMTAVVATAAPASATAAPETIRYGDRNWSVICLQQGLNMYAWTSGGKIVPAGTVDGIFGQKTLSAVRSLQAFRGRRITGVVDRTTGDDLARGMFYSQDSGQNVKDWLTYCQHTIPRYGNYPVV